MNEPIEFTSSSARIHSEQRFVGLRPIPDRSRLIQIRKSSAAIADQVLNFENLRENLQSPFQSLSAFPKLLLNNNLATDRDTEGRQLTIEYAFLDYNDVEEYVVTTPDRVFVNGNLCRATDDWCTVDQELIYTGENVLKCRENMRLLSVIDTQFSSEVDSYFNPSHYDWEVFTGNSLSTLEYSSAISPDQSINEFTERKHKDDNDFLEKHFIVSAARTPFSGNYASIPNPVYDLDHKSYRGHYWLWSVGPAITLLFNHDMTDLAMEAARDLTEFLVERPGGVDGSGILARRDPTPSVPSGFETFVPPNDSAYLAKWAWLPAFRRTGTARFKNLSLSIGKMIQGVFKRHGFLPTYFNSDRDEWDSSTYVDACFTVSFLKELYEITDNETWRDVAIAVMDDLINRLRRGPVLAANNSDGETVDKIFVRGQGWALDGLLATAELDGHKWLDMALEIAEWLIQNQQMGGWGFYASSKQIDIMTTSVIAYYMGRLHEITGDDRHESCFRTAINCCERHQRTDSVPQHAKGGLFCRSRGSGLVRGQYQNAATTLGTAYFGLAKEAFTDG